MNQHALTMKYELCVTRALALTSAPFCSWLIKVPRVEKWTNEVLRAKEEITGSVTTLNQPPFWALPILF